MSKFTYDDIVMVRAGASPDLRPGSRAWVIAVFDRPDSRPGKHFDALPEGVVYTVEFEDGSTAEMHEDNLEQAK
jgi:hypothetical protein